MNYPKYRGDTENMVRALNDHLANNGPIRLVIKFGVGRPRPYDVVDVRISEWREGAEVFGVFQQPSEVGSSNTEQHITLDQPMIDSLCRQAGIERVASNG